MRDVARLAGVSISTVSHVINETRHVSDTLQKRVLNAMDELGYMPNAIARGLVRKETLTIGMLLPDIANPFFAELSRGIEDTSYDHNYSVILCNSDGNLEKEHRYIKMLLEKRVDGIIFVAAGMSVEHIRVLQERNMPLVVIDRELAGVVVDAVLTDNADGGWKATRHLLELGHRRISCIAGPSGITLSDQRITGYCQALCERDIPIDEDLIVEGDFQCEGGYQALKQLMQVDDPPTAIFSCNDLMAIGAMHAAHDLGREVPAELSVVGFDDIRFASFINPPLSTIHQPKYEMSTLAAKMLLERIQNPDMKVRRQVLKPRLVIRRSTTTHV